MKKYGYEVTEITRKSDAGAHSRARIALERYLPTGMDWDDVNVFKFCSSVDFDQNIFKSNVFIGSDKDGNYYLLETPLTKKASFYEETLRMIGNRKTSIGADFKKECLRLLNSGAVNKEHHDRSALFGIALENLAQSYRINTKEARNLRKF